MAGIRVRFAMPQPAPLVSIIIPTRNGLDLLRQCVDSIVQRSSYTAFEIVIVDNGSDDPACLAWMRQAAQDPRISVRRDDSPFNFSALNNAAVAEARGEFIALVNNDIEVITPGWLEEMVSLAARPGIGAVGARLWYSDGTLQHGGVITGIGGGAGHAHKRLRRDQPGMMGRAQRLQALSAVTAACLVVRREAYNAVGGLDEEAFVVAFNDIDFCLKLRDSGLRNLWTPFAELYHHESVSRGSDRHPSRKQRFERERAALQARWGAALARDPAYNPNLTLNNENFALADPPRVSLLRPWFEGDTAP
jgi:GT2 family glycosyltransferase